jgi:hypothetical protein
VTQIVFFEERLFWQRPLATLSFFSSAHKTLGPPAPPKKMSTSNKPIQRAVDAPLLSLRSGFRGRASEAIEVRQWQSEGNSS